MPRRPDTPCADCGKLMATSHGSLPAGQRRCRACRTAAANGHPKRKPERTRTCASCGASFTTRYRTVRTCSLSCGQRMRARREGKGLGRECEVCGVWYRPSYAQQRTCGRACGEKLRRTVTCTMPATRRPQQQLAAERTVKCATCGTSFTCRSSRRKYCSPQCGSTLARYHADPAVRDRVISTAHARRAGALGLGDARVTIAYLTVRDRGRCGICGHPVRAKRGPMKPSIDHLIPLSRGGRHELANVQLSHYRCNLRKNAGGGGEQLMLVG